jgi:hypothetical protein
LVDEQAVSGQRREPAQLAPHTLALLVDGELEPRAERNVLETLQHLLFGVGQVQRGPAQRCGMQGFFVVGRSGERSLALDPQRDRGLRYRGIPRSQSRASAAA